MSGLRSLWECLARGAELNPAGVAIRDASRDCQLDYRDTLELAESLAQVLRSLGVEDGDRVGLCLPKSIESVIGVFASQRARAAHVPVDWSGPAERAAWIFANCEVKALIVDSRRESDLVAALAEHGCRPAVIVLDMQLALDPAGALRAALATRPAAGEDLLPVAGRTRTELGYILYTSGSTGVPKGVRISQGAALAFIEWCAQLYTPGPEDRFSSHAPFHFDLSVLDISVPLLHGGRLVLIGEDDGKNPARLVEIVEQEAITHWYSTPSILTLMLQFGKPEGRDASALRVVNFAGEVFPIKHLQALRALWPHPEYHNLYGPTETNVCTWHTLPPHPDDRSTPYPIGRVCPHYESLRVDENGQPVDGTGEGLLLIRGEGVMDGYWNAPELDARAFLELDGVRWYNTGDVVQPNAAGELEFLGRRDRMVKKRGYRIELREIETALYLHPSVLEAAVLAVSDADGGVRIRACLVPRDGMKLSIIALKRYSADNLLSYMVPDDFVFLDSLPKTSTDKTDYQRLKEMVQ
ncbi:MAG: amino acid adenylation domain-containing protein [Calditrichaeota bacterium]|nr:amino acid adenylation domain-containing protein [Calditrichota bacterium]